MFRAPAYKAWHEDAERSSTERRGASCLSPVEEKTDRRQVLLKTRISGVSRAVQERGVLEFLSPCDARLTDADVAAHVARASTDDIGPLRRVLECRDYDPQACEKLSNAYLYLSSPPPLQEAFEADPSCTPDGFFEDAAFLALYFASFRPSSSAADRNPTLLRLGAMRLVESCLTVAGGRGGRGASLAETATTASAAADAADPLATSRSFGAADSRRISRNRSRSRSLAAAAAAAAAAAPAHHGTTGSYPSLLLRISVKLLGALSRGKKAMVPPAVAVRLAAHFPNMTPYFQAAGRRACTASAEASWEAVRDTHEAVVGCLALCTRNPAAVAAVTLTRFGAARLVELLRDERADGRLLHSLSALVAAVAAAATGAAALLVEHGLKGAVLGLLGPRRAADANALLADSPDLLDAYWGNVWGVAAAVLPARELACARPAAGGSVAAVLPAVLRRCSEAAAAAAAVETAETGEEEEDAAAAAAHPPVASAAAAKPELLRRGMLTVVAAAAKTASYSREGARTFAEAGGCEALLGLLLRAELFSGAVLRQACETLQVVAEYAELACYVACGGGGDADECAEEAPLPRVFESCPGEAVARLAGVVAQSSRATASADALRRRCGVSFAAAVLRLREHAAAREYAAADLCACLAGNLMRTGAVGTDEAAEAFTPETLGVLSKQSVHGLWLRQRREEPGAAGRWRAWFAGSTALLALEVECEAARQHVAFEHALGCELRLSRWKREAALLRGARAERLGLERAALLAAPTLPADIVARQEEEAEACPERYAAGLRSAQESEKRWCLLTGRISAGDSAAVDAAQAAAARLRVDVERALGLRGYVGGGAEHVDARYRLHRAAARTARELRALAEEEACPDDGAGDIDEHLVRRKDVLLRFAALEGEMGCCDDAPSFVDGGGGAVCLADVSFSARRLWELAGAGPDVFRSVCRAVASLYAGDVALAEETGGGGCVLDTRPTSADAARTMAESEAAFAEGLRKLDAAACRNIVLPHVLVYDNALFELLGWWRAEAEREEEEEAKAKAESAARNPLQLQLLQEEAAARVAVAKECAEGWPQPQQEEAPDGVDEAAAAAAAAASVGVDLDVDARSPADVVLGLLAAERSLRVGVAEEAVRVWCRDVVGVYCGFAEVGVVSGGDGAVHPGLSTAPAPAIQCDAALQGFGEELAMTVVQEADARGRLEEAHRRQSAFVLEAWGVADLHNVTLDEQQTLQAVFRSDIEEEEAAEFGLVRLHATRSMQATLWAIKDAGMRRQEAGLVAALQKRIAKERSDLLFAHGVESRRLQQQGQGAASETTTEARHGMRRTFAELKWADELSALSTRCNRDRAAARDAAAAALAASAEAATKEELLAEQKLQHLERASRLEATHASRRVSLFVRTRTDFAQCFVRAFDVWASTDDAERRGDAIASLARARTLSTLTLDDLRQRQAHEMTLLREELSYERSCLLCQRNDADNCAAYVAVSSAGGALAASPPPPLHVARRELLTGRPATALRAASAKRQSDDAFGRHALSWERTLWAPHLKFTPLQLPLLPAALASPPASPGRSACFGNPGTGEESAARVRARLLEECVVEEGSVRSWDQWQCLFHSVAYGDGGRQPMVDAAAPPRCAAMFEEVTRVHLECAEAWLERYCDDAARCRAFAAAERRRVDEMGMYGASPGKLPRSKAEDLKKQAAEDERYLTSVHRYYKEAALAARRDADAALSYTHLAQRLETVLSVGATLFEEESAAAGAAEPVGGGVCDGSGEDKGGAAAAAASSEDECASRLLECQIATARWLVSLETAATMLFEAEAKASVAAARSTYCVQKLRVVRRVLRIFIDKYDALEELRSSVTHDEDEGGGDCFEESMSESCASDSQRRSRRGSNDDAAAAAYLSESAETLARIRAAAEEVHGCSRRGRPVSAASGSGGVGTRPTSAASGGVVRPASASAASTGRSSGVEEEEEEEPDEESAAAPPQQPSLLAARAQSLDALVRRLRMVGERAIRRMVHTALHSYIKVQWMACVDRALEKKRERNRRVLALLKEQLHRQTTKSFALQTLQMQSNELAFMEATMAELLERSDPGTVQLPPLPSQHSAMRYVPRRDYKFADAAARVVRAAEEDEARDAAALAKLLPLMPYMPQQLPEPHGAASDAALGRWVSISLDYTRMLGVQQKAWEAAAAASHRGAGNAWRVEFNGFINELTLRKNIYFSSWSPPAASAAARCLQTASAGRRRTLRKNRLERVCEASNVPTHIEGMPYVQRRMTVECIGRTRAFHVAHLHDDCGARGGGGEDELEAFEEEWARWAVLVGACVRFATHCSNLLPPNPKTQHYMVAGTGGGGGAVEDGALSGVVAAAVPSRNRAIVPLLEYAAAVDDAARQGSRPWADVRAMHRDLEMVVRGRLQMRGEESRAVAVLQLVKRLCFEQKFYLQLRRQYDPWMAAAREDTAASAESMRVFHKHCRTLCVEAEGERDLLVTQQLADRTAALFSRLGHGGEEEDEEDDDDLGFAAGTTAATAPLTSLVAGPATVRAVILAEQAARRAAEAEEEAAYCCGILAESGEEIGAQRRVLLCCQQEERVRVAREGAAAFAAVLRAHAEAVVRRPEKLRETLAAVGRFEAKSVAGLAVVRKLERENLLNEEAGELGWRDAYNQSTAVRKGTAAQDAFFKEWVHSRTLRHKLVPADEGAAAAAAEGAADAALAEAARALSPSSLALELATAFLEWGEERGRLAVAGEEVAFREGEGRAGVEAAWRGTRRCLEEAWRFVAAELQAMAEDDKLLEAFEWEGVAGALESFVTGGGGSVSEATPPSAYEPPAQQAGQQQQQPESILHHMMKTWFVSVMKLEYPRGAAATPDVDIDCEASAQVAAAAAAEAAVGAATPAGALLLAAQAAPLENFAALLRRCRADEDGVHARCLVEEESNLYLSAFFVHTEYERVFRGWLSGLPLLRQPGRQQGRAGCGAAGTLSISRTSTEAAAATVGLEGYPFVKDMLTERAAVECAYHKSSVMLLLCDPGRGEAERQRAVMRSSVAFTAMGYREKDATLRGLALRRLVACFDDEGTTCTGLQSARRAAAAAAPTRRRSSMMGHRFDVVDALYNPAAASKRAGSRTSSARGASQVFSAAPRGRFGTTAAFDEGGSGSGSFAEEEGAGGGGGGCGTFFPHLEEAYDTTMRAHALFAAGGCDNDGSLADKAVASQQQHRALTVACPFLELPPSDAPPLVDFSTVAPASYLSQTVFAGRAAVAEAEAAQASALRERAVREGATVAFAGELCALWAAWSASCAEEAAAAATLQEELAAARGRLERSEADREAWVRAAYRETMRRRRDEGDLTKVAEGEAAEVAALRAAYAEGRASFAAAADALRAEHAGRAAEMREERRRLESAARVARLRRAGTIVGSGDGGGFTAAWEEAAGRVRRAFAAAPSVEERERGARAAVEREWRREVAGLGRGPPGAWLAAFERTMGARQEEATAALRTAQGLRRSALVGELLYAAAQQSGGGGGGAAGTASRTLAADLRSLDSEHRRAREHLAAEQAAEMQAARAGWARRVEEEAAAAARALVEDEAGEEEEAECCDGTAAAVTAVEDPSVFYAHYWVYEEVRAWNEAVLGVAKPEILLSPRDGVLLAQRQQQQQAPLPLPPPPPQPPTSSSLLSPLLRGEAAARAFISALERVSRAAAALRHADLLHAGGAAGVRAAECEARRAIVARAAVRLVRLRIRRLVIDGARSGGGASFFGPAASSASAVPSLRAAAGEVLNDPAMFDLMERYEVMALVAKLIGDCPATGPASGAAVAATDGRRRRSVAALPALVRALEAVGHGGRAALAGRAAGELEAARAVLELHAEQHESLFALLIDERRERFAAFGGGESRRRIQWVTHASAVPEFVSVFLEAVDDAYAPLRVEAGAHDVVVEAHRHVVERTVAAATVAAEALHRRLPCTPDSVPHTAAVFVLDRATREGRRAFEMRLLVQENEALDRLTAAGGAADAAAALATHARWLAGAAALENALRRHRRTARVIVSDAAALRWEAAVFGRGGVAAAARGAKGAAAATARTPVARSARNVDEYLRGCAGELAASLGALRALEVLAQLQARSAGELAVRGPLKAAVLRPLPTGLPRFHTLLADEVLQRHRAEVEAETEWGGTARLCEADAFACACVGRHAAAAAALLARRALEASRLAAQRAVLDAAAARPTFVVRRTVSEYAELALEREVHGVRRRVSAAEARAAAALAVAAAAEGGAYRSASEKEALSRAALHVLGRLAVLSDTMLAAARLAAAHGVLAEAAFSRAAVEAEEACARRRAAAREAEARRRAGAHTRAQVEDAAAALRVSLAHREAVERNGLLRVLRGRLAGAAASAVEAAPVVVLTVSLPHSGGYHELLLLPATAGIAEAAAAVQVRHLGLASVPLALTCRGAPVPVYHSCARYAEEVLYVSVQRAVRRTALLAPLKAASFKGRPRETAARTECVSGGGAAAAKAKLALVAAT